MKLFWMLLDNKVGGISAYPGKRLSCQTRFRKSEHWYIISSKSVMAKNSKDIADIRSGDRFTCGI